MSSQENALNKSEQINADVKRGRLKALLAQRAIDEGAKFASQSAVLPIQPTGTLTPLFCVHGGAANLNSYLRLAEVVSQDRKIFGLQTTVHSVDDPSIKSIQKLAAGHFNAIRDHYPDGPLMLCGHSMAAVVALELAQQLIAAQRNVKMLVIIDHPGPEIRLTKRDWLFWQWIAMRALPWRQRSKFVTDSIRYRARTNQKIPLWIRKWFYSNQSKNKLQSANQPISAAEYRRRISDASLQALKEYDPKLYPNPTALIRAKSGSPQLHADAQGGWGRISHNSINVIEIPGHHMNIFQPPNVSVFGRELGNCLAQYD